MKLGTLIGEAHYLVKHSNILRICIVLEWVMAVFEVVLAVALESRLPEPLRQWQLAREETGPSADEIAALLYIIPLLLLALIGSVGLFLLKSWAAWIYLWSIVFGFALTPHLGPTVEHAWVSLMSGILSSVSGLILGLAFFSDALRNENTSAPVGVTPVTSTL